MPMTVVRSKLKPEVEYIQCIKCLKILLLSIFHCLTIYTVAQVHLLEFDHCLAPTAGGSVGERGRLMSWLYLVTHSLSVSMSYERQNAAALFVC